MFFLKQNIRKLILPCSHVKNSKQAIKESKCKQI